jgi:hypothetical protein
VAIRFRQAALTASAVSLTTIFGSKIYARQIDIKNASGAANIAYVGPSTVTNVPANAGIELSPGQAWSDVAVGASHVNTDEVFVVGTVNAANILFITLVE